MGAKKKKRNIFWWRASTFLIGTCSYIFLPKLLILLVLTKFTFLIIIYSSAKEISLFSFYKKALLDSNSRKKIYGNLPHKFTRKLRSISKP